MSDLPQPTTPAPTGQPNTPPTPASGQPGGTTPPAQAAPQTPGQPPAAEAQPQQPYRVFADQAELDGFVKSAKSQAERAGVRKLAKDMGFEDADEMRETLQALRRAQGGNPDGQPATPGADAPPATAAPSPASNQGARLQMALEVGAKLNLPAALIARLQGDSVEAMEADAQTLLGLMGSNTQRGPTIPPVPAGGQPVTYTRAQLQDPAFVRANMDAIRKAAAEGRIASS